MALTESGFFPMDLGHCCRTTCFYKKKKILRCTLKIAWLIVDSVKSQQVSVCLLLLAFRTSWIQEANLATLFKDWGLIRNCFLTIVCLEIAAYRNACTHLFLFICTSGKSLLRELIDIIEVCPLWRWLSMHDPRATKILVLFFSLLELFCLFPLNCWEKAP